MSDDYPAKDAARLWDMIKDIKICMVTTREPDGSLRSRPMASQQNAFTGELWFLTRAGSAKVEEIESHHDVNLSFVDQDKQRYVSVSGSASLVRDRELITQHWSEMARIWFPDGPADPRLALLRVAVHKAEYWDGPTSAMVVAYDYAKARLTGKPQRVGENVKLDLG